MLRKTSTTVQMAVITALAAVATSATADPISDFLAEGSVFGNVDFRYESVTQDNALEDANALTIRTRLGYKTQTVNGFSAVIEMEDNRIVLGQGDYSVGPTGYQPGVYSVIADPEHTELDQGFLQYQSGATTVKLGRQVIALDGQRFVGHVGWRHDRQTFDAVSVVFSPMDKLKVQYHFIDQRNRIFAEAADVDAKDHLLNISYQSPLGKVAAYSYQLESENGIKNGLDTYGASLTGSSPFNEVNKVTYHFEYAKQTNKNGGSSFNTDYMHIQTGVVYSGYTAKLGFEVLGSDEGESGFATPLATLHKFNGWADQFLGTPSQGLQDIYGVISGKAGGGTWLVKYHNFSADDATATVDNLGNEIDVQFVKPFSKQTKIGIKAAKYDAKDIKVDTTKVWLWLNTSF